MYTPLLEPFVHYIPVKNDSSNIEEMYNWAESQPQEVILNIIRNANQFIESKLQPIVIRKYGVALLKEYAKLLKFSPSSIQVPGGCFPV